MTHIMKKLYIIGAGEFGREFETWFHLYAVDKDTIEIAGFLDDNLKALDGFPSDFKILGKINEYAFSKDDYAVIAISNPKIKEIIYNKIKDKVNIYSFIPKNAIVGKFVDINEGCILTPNSILTTNIKLGKCVTVNIGSQIGHDCILGDFSSLMANVDLGGGVELGKRVFIGSNATIIPRIRIAEDTMIGAGSVVIRKTNPAKTVFGNPAKEI